MAHPYHPHRDYQRGHRRVGEILKGHPDGATKHADGGAFSRVTSKSAAADHDAKVAGSKGKKRFASGGCVKKADGGDVGDFYAPSASQQRRMEQRRAADAATKAKGGGVKHPDEAEDKKLIKKMIREHDDKKFARGGKVKGNTTNIIIAGGGQKQPEPVPVPVPSPSPMAGPMAGPPPGAGGPPGMPPGMPPGPLPMRARGGKVIDGEATPADIKAWGKRARDNSYFRGGAATGVGREEKAEHMRRKRR
jgi:hypothetical protein